MNLSWYYLRPALYTLHLKLPPFVRWLERDHASVVSCLPPSPVYRILEVGCGTGDLTAILAERYPEAALLAVDVSEGMCQATIDRRLRSGVEVRCCDVREVEGIFDLIVCAGTFEYLEPVEGGRLFRRLLAEHGTLVINDISPGAFGRIRQLLYANLLGVRMSLQHPEVLSSLLSQQGFSSHFEWVGTAERSYTLVARPNLAEIQVRRGETP